MPSPHRRPSRSVRVPGGASGPARLTRQPVGNLFAPDREWAHTDDAAPQTSHGPGLPPPEPAGPGAAGAGPENTSPAGTGPDATTPAEKNPAETRSASVTPADERSAGPGPAGRPAGEPPGGTGSPERPGPPAMPPRSPGPPRVPARQGPPPRPVPGPGSPSATRPGGLPAPHPGTVPARRSGGVPAARPPAGPLARRPAAQPSWGVVLATTVRLWLGRRMAKTSWRVAAGLIAAALLFGAGAVTAAATRPGTSPGTSRATGTGQRNGTAQGGTGLGSLGGALGAVAAARKQAAAWVAQQVRSNEIIGCDPMMCAALEQAHIQVNRLLMLGPDQADPLGSEILMDTATLRSQFGARLASVYAPVSLAAFGTGAARVEVRVFAPDGAHAYLAELAGDVAARKSAGAEMARNPSIHAAPAARRQLAAGEVDTRLMEMLVALSSSHPVDIISFGARQAGASPGVPLRSAEITGAPGPGSTPATSVQALRSFLIAQQTTYHPSMIAVTRTASRRTVLRVEYPAPSLLGLLGTHG
jgi:hypothetical protein